MRPIIYLTGVLGGGTALVFALAVVASVLFPNGGTVATGWNGMLMERNWGGNVVGGVNVPVAMPAVAPAVNITVAKP